MTSNSEQIAHLIEQRKKIALGGGQARVEAQHAKNKMTAANIELTPLNDETVFIARPRCGSASTVALWGHISVEA